MRITSGLLVCTAEWRCHSLKWGTLREDQSSEGREEGMLMNLVLPFDLGILLRGVSRQLDILV